MRKVRSIDGADFSDVLTHLDSLIHIACYSPAVVPAVLQILQSIDNNASGVTALACVSEDAAHS